MKLLSPLLWLAAVGVAIVVVRRTRRGRTLILRGRLAPALLHRVAVLLVVLNVGTQEVRSSPLQVLKTGPGPASVGGDSGLPLDTPVEFVQSAFHNHSLLSPLKQSMFTIGTARTLTVEAAEAARMAAARTGSPALTRLVREEINSRLAGVPPPPTDAPTLIAALDQLEAIGLFDSWLAAYLWRRSASANPATLAALYSRLHRHVRLEASLLRAFAEVNPVQLTAWMSKAMTVSCGMELKPGSERALLAAVERHYRSADAGTWVMDSTVELGVSPGASVRLLRAGGGETLPPGSRFVLGRLDLLHAPAVEGITAVRHPWLGSVVIPGGGVVSSWTLPSLLTDQMRQSIGATLKLAHAGNLAALQKLEGSMPLVHDAVRRSVITDPDTPGAPVLRTLLALFDDALAVQQTGLGVFIANAMPSGTERGCHSEGFPFPNN